MRPCQKDERTLWEQSIEVLSKMIVKNESEGMFLADVSSLLTLRRKGRLLWLL
jgi:hypothetical protein